MLFLTGCESFRKRLEIKDDFHESAVSVRRVPKVEEM